MAKDTGECQLNVAQQIWALAAAVPLPLCLPDIALESISEFTLQLFSHGSCNHAVTTQTPILRKVIFA